MLYVYLRYSTEMRPNTIFFAKNQANFLKMCNRTYKKQRNRPG